ncbi:MAG: YihY/virulence factor BrkB family protein [Weeksellaceae bacterium]|uniref:YihY/virulence factor BrkB family protein n=1 Tax=Kaistella soli TaxID=2849654 RepID=UPI001C26E501|nr:YihY/virulence factor BrkB family protein [Kaistella soli]MBU4538662.1 YihY/virulence factor BrkB family protein [Bacteroidota bacterium]MBU8882714.1 YihY/virulence factor BrkB family protein [Kaistella soli]MCG2780974.1 YihY/virulence factor BrkB family protein [Weeksellaceae bacterium]
MNYLKFTWQLLKDTFHDWNNSSASKDSASIAYYAIFSLPGLLIIVIWIAGFFFGDEAVKGRITYHASAIAGKEIADSLQTMILSAVWDNQNIWMKIFGILTLIFGATTLFFQMQRSLNTLWDVEAAPKKAFQKYILDRANSLGMILIISFLLLTSLLLSSMLGLANEWITRHFGLETFILAQIINFVVSFIVVVVLFAMMFKILPDVQISWRSVWMGAFVTALLFNIGKFLLGIYFELSKPTSIFGAAGTVILLMMWVNYSCQLVFFGAEFTKVYAYKMGHFIKPSQHAKWSAAKLLKDALHKENSNQSVG